MRTHIDINGVKVQLFEKMYDYVRYHDFSNYADEEVDKATYSEDDAEALLPNVLVRKINLYEDVNFILGKVPAKYINKHRSEFPELIEVDGKEYTQVNFGEDNISYLRTEALDEPIYTLIYRTVQITNGVYLYVYPFDTEVFETEEEAQAKADEINCS